MSGHINCAPASTGQGSNITRIRCNQIRGDISVESGVITEIDCTVTSGLATIGVSGTPISIHAGSIGYIQADAIYADISGPVGNEMGETVGALYAANGPFVGSLRMSHFVTQGITSFRGITTAGGDLDADIMIADDFDITSIHPVLNCATNGSTRGVFPSGRTITVGGKLKGTTGGSVDSNRVIDVPAGGLQGQVIVNANNTGSSPWWTAPVKVDGNSLDDAASGDYAAPYYNALSSSLGGGEVGLVPYHMHLTDCDPPYNDSDACIPDVSSEDWPAQFDTVNNSVTTRETIKVRFYGPVFDSDDSGPDDPATKPLVVELKSWGLCIPTPCAGELSSWTDETSYYDVYVPGNGSREVWVSRVLDGSGNPQSFDWQYGIRLTPTTQPGTTELRSGGTFVSPAPGVVGTYILWPLCLGRDSSLMIQDSN